MTTKKPRRYPGTSKDKKTGTWRYSFDAPRHPDGRRNQKQDRGYATQKEAFEAREAERVRLRANGYIEPSSETLDEYFARWMRDTSHGRRPPTNRGYRNAWLRYPAAFRALPLSKVTPSMVRTAYADIVTRYAPSTARETRTILSTVLGAALQDRLIPFNPCVGIKLAISRDQDEEARFDPENVWSIEESKTFLRLTEDNRDHMLWRLMLDSGLRISEALALTWDDVDLAGRIVRVRRTITSDADGRAIVGTQPKTPKSRRDVKLMPVTVACLAAYRTEQKVRRVKCGPLWLDRNVVFDDGCGSYLKREQSAKRFERLVATLPVTRLTLHGLRHTMAVTWLKAGESPAVVADRLGHASAAFTLDVYARVTGEWQESAAERVEAFIQRTG